MMASRVRSMGDAEKALDYLADTDADQVTRCAAAMPRGARQKLLRCVLSWESACKDRASRPPRSLGGKGSRDLLHSAFYIY